MDTGKETLQKAYRNGWILTLIATAFLVGFFAFVYFLNQPGKPISWDMGGTSFVPASSPEATGYYEPPQTNFTTEAEVPK